MWSYDISELHQHASVKWSPDGKYIAANRSETELGIWRAEDGKLLATGTGHSDYINSIAWRPGSTVENLVNLISGSDDKTIIFWSLSSARYK